MLISRAPPLMLSPWALNYWGPNNPFIFLVASVPLIIVPYWLVPSPLFVPKRRSQRGVAGSRALTTLSLLLETPPFIAPTSSLLVNYTPLTDTSLPVWYISSPHTCIFDNFQQFLILHNYHRVTCSIVPSSLCPLCPPIQIHYFILLLIGSLVPLSLRPVVPSPLRPVVPSSRRPFVPSSLLPVVPSSRRPFVPSSLRPIVPSSRRPFVPLSLRPFVPASQLLINPDLSQYPNDPHVLNFLKSQCSRNGLLWFKTWGSF